MRTKGVIQDDNRSCIPSCIATFLDQDALTYPLKKVGRNGDLVESHNESLRLYGCELEKCATAQIPAEGACLVLANRPGADFGHCFLFKDGSLDWDPSPSPIKRWPSDWEPTEVWRIKRVPAQASKCSPPDG